MNPLRERVRQSMQFALSVLLQAKARADDVAKSQALVAARGVFKASGGEGWAEDDPELENLEGALTTELLEGWAALELRTLDLLPTAVVATPLANGTLGYRINGLAVLADMLQNEALFVAKYGSRDGPLVRRAFAAWLRGLENARASLPPSTEGEVLDVVRAAYRASLQQRGLELVRNGAVREYRKPIVDALLSGEFDGMNPKDVARKLRKRFDAGAYNWERLATSEIAMAQSDGKLAQYRAMGITRVNYLTARDDRVSRICRSLAAAGPYPIDAAPVPVRDSHPGCRCTITPVVDDN